ncbi:MAG: alginate lyase family protein, partial [Gemmatimonadaceae bacterium]|nr:alginate lyase family protein [Gemmatimonadaceae bacterium]
WHVAPNGTLLPLLPWWRVEHLGIPGVDIKDIWEPARFAWAYDLVRAYLLTHDDRYARTFHRIFATWCEGNPPFRGVHWSCGQETSIRAIALLYAEANLATAPSSDARAMGRIAAILAASGERIASAIGQAVSQRNNHAISEAVGLLATGARFRGTHPEAVAWASRGRRLLQRLILEQFASDGWYVQHSFNYLRLALDQCVIAQRVLRSASIMLSPASAERLRAAVELLLAVMEPATGIAPNYGPNDGSFVHPITLAAYRDYRPTVTAACAALNIPLPANIPPDREALAWLGETTLRKGTAMGDGVWSGASGWAAARRGETAVFLRAGRYTSRPGDLDALQVDARIAGQEVIVDAGTFSYNAPPPWRNGLAGAAVHNGPLLDARENGVRGPRFLWLIWPRAVLREAAPDGDAFVLSGEVPGQVRRTVRVTAHGVTIEDEVLAADARRVIVRWLLHPAIDSAMVRIDGSRRVLPAIEGDPRGWFSPHYHERIPSRYIEIERDAALGYRIVCEISPPLKVLGAPLG